MLARVLGTELIRLQCYEGLDINTALYEWNYQRQLLRLRIAEREAHDPAALEDLIFSREYLLERPLLRAITRPDAPPVLLIDEIDRADDGFEAFLLEVLSDFQVTIPELGTIRATHVPYVVLTSNRTREIGDALRRRCLYLYVEHPTLEKEVRIIRARVPDAVPGTCTRGKCAPVQVSSPASRQFPVNLFIDIRLWQRYILFVQNGTIFDLKKYSINDGPGIRTTVFFSGCPLSCLWCHNPESQSLTPVLLYRHRRCLGCGACVEICPERAISWEVENPVRGLHGTHGRTWNNFKNCCENLRSKDFHRSLKVHSL